MSEQQKRIWYQGFTDPAEHHEYFGRLQALVSEVADAGTSVECHGVVPSAKDVHGLTEFRCAGQAIRNAIEAEKQGYDAFILGHFQDAGLAEIKASVDIPVIGLGETTMLYACTLGRKIGLVTIDKIFIPWHEDQIVRYGLGQRVVGVRAIDTSLAEFMRAFATEEGYGEVRERFQSQVAPLVGEGVDVVIAAGGIPMLLFAQERNFSVAGATVLNGIPLVVKQAEMAIKLRAINGTGISRAGAYAKPPAEALRDFLNS
jgi:Asp/Glu/hydantoin racemase